MKIKSMVFIIILIVMINILGTVYAATLDCNINLQTSKTEYKKGEEFKVDVSISNIKSDKGILYLSTALQYDKTCLTLVKMEGANGWETPIEGISYNPENGKIIIGKNQLGKNNEIVFTMTFLVKTAENTTTSILLKDIEVANGLETPASIEPAEKKVTIKQDFNDTDDQDPGDNNQKPNDNNNNNNSGNSNQKPNDNNNSENNNQKPNDSNNSENNNQKPNDGNNSENNNQKPNDGNNSENNNQKPNDSNNSENNNQKPNDSNNSENNNQKPNDGNNSENNNQKPNDSNNSENNNQKSDDNTIIDGVLPKTGTNENILIIFIAIIVIVLVCIKLVSYYKKIRK